MIRAFLPGNLLLTCGERRGVSESAPDPFPEQRRRKIRVGSQDLNTAALAMAEDALLLSANLRDFQKAPGLHVEDWPRE